MSRDFRAQQIQFTSLIASGSNGTGAKLLVYSIDAEDPSTPNQGIIEASTLADLSGNIGNDVFMFVSGTIGAKDSNTAGVTVYGGDVHVSGNLSVAGSGLDLVTSVFSRTGDVVAAASDYNASQIDNDSTVPGAFVDDALNLLSSSKADTSNALTASVLVNDSLVAGTFIDDALNELSGALSASFIFNDSSVAGTNVDDALNHLDGAKAESATALTASVLVNDSTIPGTFIDDAFDILHLSTSLKVSASSAVNDQRLVRWDGTSGLLQQNSAVAVDDNGNMSGINELTASSITNGAQYNGSFELIGNAGVVAVDAALGPNYDLLLSGTVILGNPTNAVEGQEITIGVHQDTVGGFLTTFSSSWTPVGQIDQVAVSASADSVITAIARDYGSGVVWDFSISHAETLTGLTDLDATTTTTNATVKTILSFPTSGAVSMGLADYSIIGTSPVSGAYAQFAVRGLYSKSGSVVTPVNDDFYSFHQTLGASTWDVTSSITSENINIRVQGGAGDTVNWKLKGIFKEHE